ncbi:DUF4232 domain-containing protein [Dactylosporangium sp. NPDC049140]|uniref:DUF4232 domain-containing protein n=1 Tax=Dactylosporangium sp. NPDC049140 TaxID=3155647 RepID=UPI0033E86A11
MTDPDEQFEGWLDRHRVEALGPVPGAYERIARTVRRRRAARVTAVAAAVAAVLTGATGIAYRIATGPGPVLPPGASPSPSVPPSPSVSPPVSPFASQEPEPAGTQDTPATATSSQSVRCHTNELKVAVQTAPGGGAQGSEYVWLVFTNVSGRTCSLYGYPGVSWVTGASGSQVNDPARRTGVAPARVVLAPGAVAHAQVRYGKPEMYGEECQLAAVAGFRVYPPDETAAVFVPLAGRACSAKGVGVAEVWPIVAGLSG